TRTEMTFALGGQYSRLYATLGVDDSAGDLGQVAFKVLADGRSLHESEPLSGSDAARPLALDVEGVNSLTLVADFGSAVAASGNFADWAEARVVRQADGFRRGERRAR
ncbi:MAG: NPCBM/NEW2 domain-containing protein, partial [Candidatus Brocadiae bacterium]|nr:NPCBM/NEW2 domain-containing protein [Candidatus Brocadiia bacterium]